MRLHFMHASLVVLMTGCLLMPSCTDALDNSRQSNYIRFMPEVQSSWFQLSRANSEPSTRYAVLPVKADGTVPIYLHTLYTDSIQSQPDDEAETRAAPVSAANIYTSFGVLAYTYTGAWDGTQSPNYMYDVPVSKSGNTWTPPSTYYWPGEAYKVRFFAYAPKSNNAYRLSGQTAGHPTLTCTVPDDVADQADLLVAASGEINGNSNIPVNLTFHHALTAVKFVCGNDMNPGVVKRVTLKNVYSQGTYDLDDQTWKDHGRTTSFTQELNKTAQGTEGEAITSEAQTFMMIPQTLPEAAKIEVIFADAKGEHTLSATLAKSVWPMGKTVTYKISITPEYEFKLSEERILDAHYEIYKTNLVVSGVPSGQSWTISAPDNVTIQAQSDMNSWAQQGYWTEKRQETDASGNLTDIGSARGEASYSGRGSGDFPIAIFVPENIGDEKRSIVLSVTVNGSVVQTINIEQYAPSWYGNGIGCERIEGRPQPWGFYWSGDYALTFDLKSCNEDDRTSLRRYVEWTQGLHDAAENPWIGWLVRLIFGDNIPDLSFITMEKSGDILGIGGRADKITINLWQLNTGNIAESTDNGQQNTRDIYNFQGIQLVNEIINRIQDIRGYNSSMMTKTGTGTFPDNNAAIACMKLNSWNVVVTPEIPGVSESEEMLQLSNNSPNPDWYLPASAEVSGIKDEVNALNGDYWTSTSVAGSHENAYKYDASGNVTSTRRDTELHVRAVRKKP